MIVRDENGGPEILLRKGYEESEQAMAWGFNEEPDSFDMSDVGTKVDDFSEEEELPGAD